MQSEEKKVGPKTLDYETDRELQPVDGEPAPAHPRRFRRMRRVSRKLAIVGVVALIVAVGLFLWVGTWNRVSTDDAQVDGHIVPVSSKVYGNVVEVLVDDNQQVKAGRVLVRIDPRDYQVRV